MKKVVCYCDRCGGFTGSPVGFYHIQLERSTSSGAIFELLNGCDLCLDCFESLKDWLCNYEEKEECE